MRVRSALGTLVLVLTLGWMVPAAHAQYPPTVGAGRVSRSELKQCQCTLFTGDGFEPGSTVPIFDRGPDGVTRAIGSTTADNRGAFRFKVCFDEHDDEGTHTLIGRGTGADGRPREVRATVRVQGNTCYRKGDEIHSPSEFHGDGDGNGNTGNGTDGNGNTGNGTDGTGTDGTGTDGTGTGGTNGNVGGVRNGRGADGLPRTGAEYVLPGLLLGFLLVVTGSGAVHVARRRRLVAP